MGWHEAIFDALNDWSKQYWEAGLPESFDFHSDDSWDDAGRKLRDARLSEGFDFPEGIIEPLAAFPDVIADVMYRAARTSFKNHRPMRWAWKPGYSFEVNVSQTKSGYVTVLVTTPYPEDMEAFNPAEA